MKPDPRVFVTSLPTAFNPLTRYPRNLPCFCGSTRKAKACCLGKLQPTVEPHQVQPLREAMAKVVAQGGGKKDGHNIVLKTRRASEAPAHAQGLPN